MKKILTMLVVAAMFGVAKADNVQFRYTLKVKDSTVTDSMTVFGRDNEATDGIDKDYDFPSIPNIESQVPMAGPVQDFYFRAQVSIAGEDESVDTAYDKLYSDIRSASKDATTWTLCTYSNPVELSWEGKYYDQKQNLTINSALADGEGELKLCNSANEVVVADMRTTTSTTLAANSVYNIKYIGKDASSEAPETPQAITDEFVAVSGSSSEFQILDVDKYTLVDWTLCFYYATGKDAFGNPVLKKFADKDIKMADDNDNATYDAETGKFKYTFSAEDFDKELAEIRLLYSYKYKNDTRYAADNSGVATGMLRSVVADVIIKLDDDSERVINVKGTDDEKKTTVDFTVETGEKLTLYGEFTLPEWNDKKIGYDPWTVSIKVDGEDVKGVITDGNPSVISFTSEKPLVKLAEVPTEVKKIKISVTLTGDANCKSGNLTFAPRYTSYDDTEKTADALAAAIKVKGLANLDIDGSDDGTDFDPVDIRLLYNFCLGGSDDDEESIETLFKNTKYIRLAEQARAAKAKEICDKINEMVDSLDIDGDGDFAPVDIRLLYNYCLGGSEDDEDGINTLLKNTKYNRLTGNARADKAKAIRDKIGEMVNN